MIYADTSFFFSFYALDSNSPAAASAYAADARCRLFLSPWQRFELRNAVRLAVHRLNRAKVTIPFQPGNVFKWMQEDLDNGRLRHAEVDWRESMRLAEELSAEHTEITGAASVDVWHVAAAVLLEANTFWTFDAEQREMAMHCGKFRKVPLLKA
jgi:hypothetical protein